LWDIAGYCPLLQKTCKAAVYLAISGAQILLDNAGGAPGRTQKPSA
jgi:hypothetical protein